MIETVFLGCCVVYAAGLMASYIAGPLHWNIADYACWPIYATKALGRAIVRAAKS